MGALAQQAAEPRAPSLFEADAPDPGSIPAPGAAEHHGRFFHAAIEELAPRRRPAELRVLDLGCGAGRMVAVLLAFGYDAHGCDFENGYSLMDLEGTPRAVRERIRQVDLDPYRLPFADEAFDVVVSTQVLEHVQNKIETLREVRRVLKPGGVTLHVFPSKWSLPVELHIKTPFVSWMWPRVPRVWLQFWALVGVRNEYQRGQDWRQVASENERFCREAIDYRDKREMLDLFRGCFSRAESPMPLLIRNAMGPRGAWIKRLPGLPVTAALLGMFRQRLVVAWR